MRKKQFFLRGIDRRSNPLYREEGTAYDARNCLLDHSRRLTKFPDFDLNIIPRGTLGETGDFLTKLPYGSIIIDLMPYEDYIVIATTIEWNNTVDNIPVNRFYKWIKSTNTIEFIPFACETITVSTIGQIAPRVQAAIGGKLEYVEQENVLFFIGQYPDTQAIDFSNQFELTGKENNLTPIFVYDGKVITRAGCPQIFNDTQEDIGSLTATDDEYCRIVPFKIDDKGRTTFGNFSTHFFDYSSDPSALLTKVTLSSPTNFLNTTYGHQVFCKTLSNYYLDSESSPASRTINIGHTNPFDIGVGYSIGVGQYLYFIKRFTTYSSVPAPYTSSIVQHVIYRCTVEAFTAGSPSTIQLGEFKTYDSVSSTFKDTQFLTIDTGIYMSNILLAIYASKEYSYGYEFKGYSVYGIDSSLFFEFFAPTTEGTSSLTQINYGNTLNQITDLFEDMYDQETTKIIPPLVNSLVNYGSSLIMTDHENLYFTDLSVGGTIENITPFDFIPVGSSKRGPVTGVFANESFITVFREEESYYIQGNIFLGNYRIQSYQSTRIGCTDSRGIAEISGAGIFPSKRGFYLCQTGAQMSEISDAIEPIFIDNDLDLQIDLTDVKAIVDFDREYVHFLCKSNTLESGWAIFSYSYYLKEWFITDNVNGSGGFTDLNRKLYYSDGTNIYSEGTTAVDSEAYYISNFETLNDPSLRKKFIQVLVYSISQEEAGSVLIQNYKDWDYSDTGLDTSESEITGGTKKIITRRLNPNFLNSCAIKLLSPEGNQMLIDGYEYEVTGAARMYKNEDQ